MDKYFKYKQKYLNLKKQRGGGKTYESIDTGKYIIYKRIEGLTDLDNYYFLYIEDGDGWRQNYYELYKIKPDNPNDGNSINEKDKFYPINGLTKEQLYNKLEQAENKIETAKKVAQILTKNEINKKEFDLLRTNYPEDCNQYRPVSSDKYIKQSYINNILFEARQIGVIEPREYLNLPDEDRNKFTEITSISRGIQYKLKPETATTPTATTTTTTTTTPAPVPTTPTPAPTPTPKPTPSTPAQVPITPTTTPTSKLTPSTPAQVPITPATTTASSIDNIQTNLTNLKISLKSPETQAVPRNQLYYITQMEGHLTNLKNTLNTNS